MWEINNSLQLLGVARSVLLGVFFCLIYDVLRALRKVNLYSAFSVFFQDIFYALFLAIFTFFFLLGVTNGELRLFVFLGIAVGFIISRLTFSRIFFRILTFVFSKIKVAVLFVSVLIYGGFDKLCANVKLFCQKSDKTLKNS